MFMSKLSVNRSVISAARHKYIPYDRYILPSLKYVYHLVIRCPHRLTNNSLASQRQRELAHTPELSEWIGLLKPSIYIETTFWLHAKSFILLTLSLYRSFWCFSIFSQSQLYKSLFIISVPSVIFLWFYFTLVSPPFTKVFVCNYNVSNIIINIRKTLVKAKSICPKNIHFVVLVHWFFGCGFTLARFIFNKITFSGLSCSLALSLSFWCVNR